MAGRRAARDRGAVRARARRRPAVGRGRPSTGRRSVTRRTASVQRPGRRRQAARDAAAWWARHSWWPRGPTRFAMPSTAATASMPAAAAARATANASRFSSAAPVACARWRPSVAERVHRDRAGDAERSRDRPPARAARRQRGAERRRRRRARRERLGQVAVAAQRRASIPGDSSPAIATVPIARGRAAARIGRRPCPRRSPASGRAAAIAAAAPTAASIGPTPTVPEHQSARARPRAPSRRSGAISGSHAASDQRRPPSRRHRQQAPDAVLDRRVRRQQVHDLTPRFREADSR